MNKGAFRFSLNGYWWKRQISERQSSIGKGLNKQAGETHFPRLCDVRAWPSGLHGPPWASMALATEPSLEKRGPAQASRQRAEGVPTARRPIGKPAWSQGWAPWDQAVEKDPPKRQRGPRRVVKSITLPISFHAKKSSYKLNLLTHRQAANNMRTVKWSVKQKEMPGMMPGDPLWSVWTALKSWE